MCNHPSRPDRRIVVRVERSECLGTVTGYADIERVLAEHSNVHFGLVGIWSNNADRVPLDFESLKRCIHLLQNVGRQSPDGGN